jgi:hypothetical protein
MNMRLASGALYSFGPASGVSVCTRFTCFTSTKVQILTPSVAMYSFGPASETCVRTVKDYEEVCGNMLTYADVC